MIKGALMFIFSFWLGWMAAHGEVRKECSTVKVTYVGNTVISCEIIND